MRIFVMYLAFTLAACAQLGSEWKTWRFQLNDGAYVSFIGFESTKGRPSGSAYYRVPDLTGSATFYNNTIEHVIEERGRRVLAYRLRIEPAGEAAYLLTIEPVAGAPYFSQAPNPFQVMDGQRAEIDLATSRDGYVKAVASIQVTRYERRRSNLPAVMAKSHDLTLDALQLMVSDAQVFKNNVRIAEHAGGVTGSMLVAYLPEVGHVFFSLLPQKDFDFTKTAVVENNRIIFDIGLDHYEIASQSSVIGQPGSWNIYMLRVPNTTPCDSSVDASKPFIWSEGPEGVNCKAP